MRTIIPLSAMALIIVGAFALTLHPKPAISEVKDAVSINTYALTLKANPVMAESSDAN